MLAYVIFFFVPLQPNWIMRLLLIILTVMTWTVKDKSTVTGDGQWPYDIEVAYSCTYQKGTVCADDEAVLTLGNLGGITVQKVELSMRSNKSAGAGVITVKANGQQAARMEGSFADWTGAYDANDFHTITVLSQPCANVNTLSVSVRGTQNSLYIERFTITYVTGGPRTVTLMKGAEIYTTLTEQSSGAGVLLPALADTADWQFIGWSRTEFRIISSMPALYMADTRFYPGADMPLWAVYMYAPQYRDANLTDLQSGRYIYWNPQNSLAMAGMPENGVLGTAVADPTDENQHYDITFNATLDSARIQHVYSGLPIGYSGTNIVSKPSWWQVWHEGDKTVFYITVSAHAYAVLYPSMIDGYGEAYYSGLYRTDNVATAPTALKASREPEEVRYTCHPEAPEGIHFVPADSKETVIPFGIYELHLINGQKQLRLR